MKSVIFGFEGASAELELWENGMTATLSALNARFKMRGTGNVVLEQALEYADWKQLEVVLEVSPFGEAAGMDKTELRAWYMSKGFKWEGDGVMARPAKTEQAAGTLMEERPWGEFQVSKFPEEEAAEIVDLHGLDKAHFYIQEGA